MSDIEEPVVSVIEAVPAPVNRRRQRSAAQQEAFERARQLRAENIAKRRAERDAEKARIREERERAKQLKRLQQQYAKIPDEESCSSDDELQTAQSEAPPASKEAEFIQVDMDQLARGVASHLTNFFTPPSVKQAIKPPPVTIRYI